MVLYLRHLVRAAAERGWRVDLVTTRAALAHPAYAVVRAEAGDVLDTFMMDDITFPARPNAVRLLLHQLKLHRIYARAFRRYQAQRSCDVVYVGNMDHCDRAIALLGSPFGAVPFVGMSISIRHHHRAMGVRGPGTRHDALYARLFERLLRVKTLRALATIDETLPRYARQQRISGCRKVHHVADVARLHGTADRAAVRTSLGIAPDDIVVLAYGALDPRKGIAELIAAAASPACSTRVVVLLAGRQNAFVRDLLKGADAQQLRTAHRLVEVSGFLGDQREVDVFSATDIVWVAYRRFYGASGVLIQAGAMRLPVVACEDGLIGWTTHRHGLGEIVDPGSRESVTAAINRLAGDDALRRTYGANGAQLAAAHTPEAFGTRLCNVIASAATLPEPLHP